jgi:hypothetical protein
MTLEQSILEAVRSLPPDKQQEVLEHAKRLQAEGVAPRPRKSMHGLWADLGISSLSAEEIDEARREAWKGFPRDDI